jgi:hypothetical protein
MTTITAKRSATSGLTAPDVATVDQIRRRAYELYEEHGREDGHDVEDWLQAEAEITGKTERAAA